MTDVRVKKVYTAKQTPDTPQMRDTFETPAYAVELLLPFIPKDYQYIWECAVGNGRISGKLCENGYVVCGSDIRYKQTKNRDNEIFFNYNFLNWGKEKIPPVIDDWFMEDKNVCVITNPPFSIKHLFIEKCLEYNMPFALLINADYSGQAIDWITRGCEKIVPTSRISYITPNILNRIHEGEVWNILYDKKNCKNLKEFKEKFMPLWTEHLYINANVDNYSTIEECPNKLLYKYSSAQFHSMWLTYKFNLGKSETFVELTSKQKRNIK